MLNESICSFLFCGQARTPLRAIRTKNKLSLASYYKRMSKKTAYLCAICTMKITQKQTKKSPLQGEGNRQKR